MIADRSLHGDQGWNAAAQQRLGEARGLTARNAAVAGIDQHQRQRPSGAANWRQQTGRGGAQCAALFVLKFQRARQAVAGQMQHMIGIEPDCVSDDFGMSDFENADLAVLMEPGRFDPIENVLQLPFLVEHRAGTRSFIRGGDGNQDFQRPGERRLRFAVKAERPAHHHDGRLQGEHPAAGQAGRLEGQSKQFGPIRLPADFHNGPDRTAIDEGGECRARIARQAKLAQCVAEPCYLGVVRLELSGGGGVPPQSVPEPLQKRGLRFGKTVRQRGEHSFAVLLRADPQFGPDARGAVAA
jgi:hypothetical protein